MRIVTPLKGLGLGLAMIGLGGVAFGQVTLTFSHNQAAQLQAVAGTDQLICPGDTTVIGGNPVGGTAPFSFLWTPSAGLSSNNTATTSASPSNSTTYTVLVIDANGCSSSDSMVVTVDTCVGISDIAGLGKISVFPNPNAGNFRIEVLLEKSVSSIEFRVSQLNGQQVFSRVRSNPGMTVTEDINLTTMAKGIYLVNIALDGQVITKKVLVQ